MWDALTNFFLQELKAHPRLVFLMLMMVAAALGAGTMLFVQQSPYQDHLSDFDRHRQHFEEYKIEVAADINGVSGAIADLKTELKRKELRQEIRSIEAEIYQLERIQEQGEATNRDIDRLDDLKSDRTEAQDDLEMINSGNNNGT